MAAIENPSQWERCSKEECSNELCGECGRMIFETLGTVQPGTWAASAGPPITTSVDNAWGPSHEAPAARHRVGDVASVVFAECAWALWRLRTPKDEISGRVAFYGSRDEC